MLLGSSLSSIALAIGGFVLLGPGNWPMASEALLSVGALAAFVAICAGEALNA